MKFAKGLTRFWSEPHAQDRVNLVHEHDHIWMSEKAIYQCLGICLKLAVINRSGGECIDVQFLYGSIT